MGQPVFKTKNNRMVYGGGGITPDVFISNDNSLSEQSQSIIIHPSRLLFTYANQIKIKFTQLEEEY